MKENIAIRTGCWWVIITVLLTAVLPGRAGTWVSLANQAPGGVDTMLLLSDGTVMAADGNNSWYRLTPDSHGSYANGTWTTLASMHDTRLYYSSQVLTNGRVFIAGAEYGTGTNSAEIYNPLTDTWTVEPSYANGQLLDSESIMLSDGNVLVSPVYPSAYGTPAIYNVATNGWSVGPGYVRGYYQDEATWVKLPDQSILTIDPFGSHSERYIPALKKWVDDAVVPVSLYASDSELGAGLLLPNGSVFFLGGTTNTALYTPSGTTNAGVWTAGPNIPNGLGAPDAPAAMMPNGKILCELGPAGTFDTPASFYEYDYTLNSLTAVSSPNGNSFAPYYTRMLDLPDGSVLFSWSSTQLYIYQPDGSPLAAGKPVITGLTTNSDGSYHLSGLLLNGISQGASYGDDAQMDSNYPLICLTNASGVYYARTYNWSSTGVMLSNTPVSTEFMVPESVPGGVYALFAVANGIRSEPVTFSPDALRLSPASNAVFAVAYGSTNSDSATYTYTLTNSGATALNWSLANGAGWLVFSRTNGTLAAGATTTVTVSLAAVTNFDTGNYSTILTFSNLTSQVAHSLAGNLIVAFADTPVGVSGFNFDAVVERSATSGNTARFAQAFDAYGSFTFFEVGLNANNYTGGNATQEGLPTNHVFTSAADRVTTFQIMPYNSNNVLYLTSGSPTGTLTFSNPAAYNSLSILATSANGNGGSNGTVVLNFADGSSSAALNYQAPDWYYGSGAALTHFGRVYVGSYGAFYTDNPSGNNPNLYQTTLNLASLGLNTNQIASLTFTMLGGTSTPANAATGIFAVSGSRLVVPTLSVTHQGTTNTFTWKAYSGQPYTLQYTTNLAGGVWTTVGSFMGTNSTMRAVDAAFASDQRRFYRLKLSTP